MAYAIPRVLCSTSQTVLYQSSYKTSIVNSIRDACPLVRSACIKLLLLLLEVLLPYKEECEQQKQERASVEQ